MRVELAYQKQETAKDRKDQLAGITDAKNYSQLLP